MLLVAVASIFLTTPAPMDMPRAEAFLVKAGAVRRLEDRYNVLDLWLSRAVEGCWIDGEGRIFSVAKLEFAAPALLDGETRTRAEYAEGCVRIDKRDKKGLRRAIGLLSPVEPAEEGAPARQLCRGYKDIDYWQGTNREAIVCAFLPERGESWYLASWQLAANDEFDERLEKFENEFLAKEFLGKFAWKDRTATPKGGERELLRCDAAHSVAAYPNWHVTDSDEFSVLDDLTLRRDFVVTLTNELREVRAKYAATLPTPIDGTNVLCVARIFATRDEFLEAAGDDMAWSAAYWSPTRRELVAYLPQDGVRELLRTLRHESFHQYLSYACSMITVSPWLNEGYAQYFEDPDDMEWGVATDVELLAPMVPDVLKMDYGQFYAGTALERQLRYRIAWSIAQFVEKGAAKVRFQPFKNLKADYVEALIEGKDMALATEKAFRNADNLTLFINEWKKFWKDRQ